MGTVGMIAKSEQANQIIENEQADLIIDVLFLNNYHYLLKFGQKNSRPLFLRN